jgi:AAA+ superfamily predicted ATPase
MLGEAIATDLGYGLMCVKGSDIHSRWPGEHMVRLQYVFEISMECSPSVFFRYTTNHVLTSTFRFNNENNKVS